MTALLNTNGQLNAYIGIIQKTLEFSGVPQTVFTLADAKQAYEDRISPTAAASYFRDRYLQTVEQEETYAL